MMKCLIHPNCKTRVTVNGEELCYECWNNANKQEREWFEKATDMYARGLITRSELDDTLSTIAYHEVDPTVPVFI